MFYHIPESLSAEIDGLAKDISANQAGEMSADALKARRVPFGCYEQRRDGQFMLRIRTPGGAVTPAQLRVMAELAGEYGSDFLHITTRQEFQIHDLSLDSVIPAMHRLMDAGLSCRGGGGNTVRNMLLSPDAGVAVTEVFDPSAYVFALTSRLIAEPDSWTLPRKLKFAFSNSEADNALARFNDVGFLAKTKEGVKGFAVCVAGGMGGKPQPGQPLHDFIPATDVYLVAEAIKQLFAKYGNRENRNKARLRFLWNDLGREEFIARYAAERAALEQTYPAPLALEPQPEPRDVPAIAPIPASGADFDQWQRRFVETQAQSGLISVVLPVSLGNFKRADALALADFLEPLGDDVVRAGFGQNIRLRNIPVRLIGNVYQLVRHFDPLQNAPRLVTDAVSCTGADTCKLGICLPKGAMTAIHAAIRKSGLSLDALSGFRLHISGCPNSCGQHPIADLGFFGGAGKKNGHSYPAYTVVAGARIHDPDTRFAASFGRVPARNVPDFVCDVLKIWQEKQSHFASFAEYVDGEGAVDLRAAIARHGDVADFEIDPAAYTDWGASAAFTLSGRGISEETH